MPRHADVVCPPKAFTILTDGADATITTVRLVNLGDFPLRIQATATNVAPANNEGALKLDPSEERILESLAQLFPGVTAPLHLWGWSEFGTQVSSSHA